MTEEFISIKDSNKPVKYLGLCLVNLIPGDKQDTQSAPNEQPL